MRSEPASMVIPRWYQDLSIPQMENVFALGNALRADNAEQVTGRTQRTLSAIGVTSTFVKITAKQIKKFRRLTDLDPTRFLSEIYRSITGESFIDEGYKKVYDCNERIILSAIAFLTFSEAIVELHRRIPMGEAPKFPPKPALLGNHSPPRRAKSPYLDRLFTRSDWLTYRKEMDIWRQQREKTATPRVILPPFSRQLQIHDVSSNDGIEKVYVGNEEKVKSYQERKPDGTKDNRSVLEIENKAQFVDDDEIIFDKAQENIQRSYFPTSTEYQIKPRLTEKKILKNRSNYSVHKSLVDISYENRSDNPEYGIAEIKRSWLGEKNMQLIIAGSAVNDDSPNCPISLETKGLTYVTPVNSDEKFFAALNFDGTVGKTYLQGRENLSRKRQEWLQDVDEEYMKVEKEANKILKGVQQTLRLMNLEATCDTCCACRQTIKSNKKYHEMKMPHIVIETIATNENKNKYLVGALAMTSPAPSPSESTDDIPEIIVSQDKIINNRVVDGVTNDMGNMTYHVSGVNKYVKHIPQKIVSHTMLSNFIKNVPPCGCSSEKTINEGLSTISNDDNIPEIKNQQLCIGKKYRPLASGISACQNDPNDKSCKSNPLKKRINDQMAVGGGLSGEGNIPDAEKLAWKAAEEKIILKSDKSRKTAEASSKRSRMRESQVREKGKKKASNEGGRGSENSKARTESERETAQSLQNLGGIERELRGKSKDERQHQNGVAEMTRKQKLKEIKNRWNKMKKSMNKFVQPSPFTMEKLPKMYNREVKGVRGEELTVGEQLKKESTFGWRTKSEQELPPQKTIVYLVDSKKPVEDVPVRAGGKPCKCRENRNARKILLYGVSAMTEEGKEGKRDEKLTRVIDGLIHITPTPSVRNSEEYIPEYDLYDLPYKKCVRDGKNDNFQYIERYLGPKSLMVISKPRASTLCKCSTTEDSLSANDAKHSRIQENANESTEKEWPAHAFQDEGIIDFYSRGQDNIPCWLTCAEFSRDNSCRHHRSLQIKRPVCECKYERKIVKREEEKENWLRRQARLKSHNKLPYRQIEGISRPMQMETNIVISDVKRTPRKNHNVDDIEYCVSSIAQNFVPGPAEHVLSRIGMHTPVSTPNEPSKEEIRAFENHHHRSLTDIYTRPAISMNAQAFAMRDTDRTNPNNRQNVNQMRVATEHSKSRDPKPIKNHDLRLENSRNFPKESKKLKQKELPLAPSTTIQRNNQSPTIHSLQVISGMKPTTTKLLEEKDKNKIPKLKSTKTAPPNKDGISLDSHGKTNEISHKTNTKKLLKVELEKMANEGFLFAKLPACWHFPQLQYWLMYRQGIALPLEEKKKLMMQSLAIWNSLEKQNSKKIQAPLLQIPEEMMENCNYDEASTIKHEITLKRELFLSDVRKLRVLQARNMWGLMEFGRFPGISFKKAFFTYQASKESDGFVFKPWENK